MSASIGVLNYFAFFVLYVICFVFIYKQYTEIIGFSILIVINIACFLYTINDVMNILQFSVSFVQMFACLSIVIGLIISTVIVSFILVVANNLNVKYSKKYGTPLNLPNKYKNTLEIIKGLLIASFCLGSVILYSLTYYSDDLKQKLFLIVKYLSLKIISENKLLVFVLTSSSALIGIVVYALIISLPFSKLSRQELMDMQ